MAGSVNVFVRYAWLIPLLPIVSAGLTLFFGKRTPGRGAVYGIAALAATMLMSLGVLWHFVQGNGVYAPAGLEWFTIGPLRLELGMYVDGLTAAMLVVVTTISLSGSMICP